MNTQKGNALVNLLIVLINFSVLGGLCYMAWHYIIRYWPLAFG